MKRGLFLCSGLLAVALAGPAMAMSKTTTQDKMTNAATATIERGQVENLVQQLEQTLTADMKNQNQQQAMSFMEQHIADDAEIWMRTSVQAGNEVIGSGMATMNKDQFLKMGMLHNMPAGTQGDVSISLTEFQPIEGSNRAKAIMEISKSMTAEGATVETTSSCEHEVWISEDRQTVMLGDAMCENNVKL